VPREGTLEETIRFGQKSSNLHGIKATGAAGREGERRGQLRGAVVN